MAGFVSFFLMLPTLRGGSFWHSIVYIFTQGITQIDTSNIHFSQPWAGFNWGIHLSTLWVNWFRILHSIIGSSWPGIGVPYSGIHSYPSQPLLSLTATGATHGEALMQASRAQTHYPQLGIQQLTWCFDGPGILFLCGFRHIMHILTIYYVHTMPLPPVDSIAVSIPTTDHGGRALFRHSFPPKPFPVLDTTMS